MKKIIIITLIALLLIGGLVVYKNTSNPTLNKEAVLGTQIKAVNGQIIDVREPEEYATSHANNAINIPLDDILGGDFSKINKDRPIYVYCRSGTRAGEAKVALEKAGYKEVTNIGGLENWVTEGGSVCNTSKLSC